MTIQDKFSSLDIVNPEQLSKVRVNRKVNFMLREEFENLCITLFQAHIERVFVIEIEHINLVE